MRYGVVVGTDLSGLGRKIFHKGDTASENNFPAGNYQKLVSAGWIDEGKKTEPEAVKEPIIEGLDLIEFGSKGKRKK